MITGTNIAIPGIFQVFNLTKGKGDRTNPLNPERGSIGGYRDA